MYVTIEPIKPRTPQAVYVLPVVSLQVLPVYGEKNDGQLHPSALVCDRHTI
jgi:hypothetical protein